MSRPEVRRYPDPAALAEGAARTVVELIGRAVAGRGECRLALAGGGTPRPVYERLAEGDLAVAWDRVEVFFGDERCVPADDPHSNFRMADAALLSRVPIPADRVHRIEGELDPEEAAARYADVLGDQPLDLVLLGMGGDGHTASLFPGGGGMGDDDPPVVVTRSPVPPVARVSLSLRTLDAAGDVCFLVSGEGKAERLAEVLRQRVSGSPELPSARVHPGGRVIYLVDEAAAARIDPSMDQPERSSER